MIKCNVTVCGTVCRQAQMRANKEGKQFISFGISVVVQAKTGINKTVEISVRIVIFVCLHIRICQVQSLHSRRFRL